jgi:hypothetical protein
MMATAPTVAACHVRGLGTPFATYTTRPTGARSAGASMGLTLQGVPLVREWCSSRSPFPPDVAGRPNPPKGAKRVRPPTGPCSRDESVLASSTPRREHTTVDAFLGFPPSESSPHPPGPSLVVTMPALSSSGGMTSLPTWTPGLRGSNGSAWSVSGLPTLMGFCTLRPSRHSVPRRGERAHGFASRRTTHPKARHQLRSKLPRRRGNRGS